MPDQFFKQPVLNSPYDYPGRHWELDEQGQPTQRIIERRRNAEFITPIPRPRKRKGRVERQLKLLTDEGLSTQEQQYNPTSIVNRLRPLLDQWRSQPDPKDWKVTPETARLLRHWRQHPFSNIRPFFCQVEAVETAIWLTEVAPKCGYYLIRGIKHLDGMSLTASHPDYTNQPSKEVEFFIADPVNTLCNDKGLSKKVDFVLGNEPVNVSFQISDRAGNPVQEATKVFSFTNIREARD